MKTIIFFILLILFFQKNVFALSLSEELTQLNNLYKEGAITKEEFSKAKSILLKSDAETKATENIKKDKKIKKIKKNKVKKKIINEDLTKSYIHIDEIDELGTFKIINEAPEGMFKVGKSFTHRAKLSSEKMYLIFVQQKNLMEKNPENLMKAMGYFEFFYMEQLKKKKKNLTKFKEKWPYVSISVRKDMKSLYSLNQARKSMREAMGLTLQDDIQDALKRYMLMHDFLSKAKKQTVKLTAQEKKLRKFSKKLNSGLTSIEKNIKLRKDQRISEKQFKKDIKKNIKKTKFALQQLSKDPDNMNFYKSINDAFVQLLENNSDLDLSLDGLIFIKSIVKDVEKDIIPKKYIQNMDGISLDGMTEDDQKILASVSLSMKMQKKEKKDMFHNSMLNLSNNGVNLNKYIDDIQKIGFDLNSVTMTFDDFDNMKRWASKDWAKSWKGKLPSEIKDSDGNVIKFTDENIVDLKAQLALNTFNEMLDFDQSELKGSINDNIKEIAKEIESSGGFNINDYLNQDFSITLDNYSKLVGNDWGIEINNFNDLTRAVNEIEGTNMSPEEYAKHWQSSDHWGDSGLNWGEITKGVDLIDQVGSFDAASIAKELGADLQEVADTITQAASVGVSTDLEAAAQGLGYGSFADAVAAYNQKYGTNYTVESAKEALGQ